LDAEAGTDGEPGSPGAAGVAGSNGATGGQGPLGPAVFLEAEQPEEPAMGIPGPQGVSGVGVTVRRTAKQSNITSTLAKVTSLDAVLGAGTYTFKYSIIHQSAAATTGQKYAVNFTGTSTKFVLMRRHPAVSSTATDTTESNSVIGANWVLPNTQVSIAVNDTLGPTTAIANANTDAFTIIEGVVVVTVSGTLEFYFAGEVSATNSIEDGSSLVVIQTA
jgi:hypothetical protein